LGADALGLVSGVAPLRSPGEQRRLPDVSFAFGELNIALSKGEVACDDEVLGLIRNPQSAIRNPQLNQTLVGSPSRAEAPD